MIERIRAILMTPRGASAIASVRLAGEGVEPFLKSIFDGNLRAGRAVHGRIRKGASEVDDPLVYLHEDKTRADIHLHGGAWVVSSFLELARDANIEIVDSPAVRDWESVSDGADEIEREIIGSLPLATTELGLRALLAQREAWRSFDTWSRAQVTDVLADHRSLHWLLHPPTIAIVGEPNVGKSTLANRLFGQERSIVADLPGTTRDWVGEMANIDGLPAMLVDTPGQRETSDEIERAAIEQSRGKIRAADLVIVVLDATTFTADLDQLTNDAAGFVGPHPNPLPGGEGTRLPLIVVNKIDQSNNHHYFNVLPISARDGEGIDELRDAIRERFECHPFDPNAAHCWTHRQRDLLMSRLV